MVKKMRIKQKVLLTNAIFISTLLVSTQVLSEESFYGWLIDFSRTKGVNTISNELYEEECSACHFPYQPGLLPSQSWEKLLKPKQLVNHFGDNAELDEDVRKKILVFAVDHAAEKSWYKRSRKIVASLNDNQFPIRITKTPYIKSKHEEIPTALIRDNDKINSLSYCDNCHTKAKQGIYDNDSVDIPEK